MFSTLKYTEILNENELSLCFFGFLGNTELRQVWSINAEYLKEQLMESGDKDSSKDSFIYLIILYEWT